MKRAAANDLHKKWMKNPKYRREYETLEEGFSLAAALIDARARAGLTQEQVTAYEDHAGRCRASGRRGKHAIDADPRKICQGNRHPAQNQL